MSDQFTLLACDHGNASLRTPIIRRNDYSVCTVEYVVSGRGHLEINGRSFEVKQDSVYFLHKHSTHAYWPDRDNPWQKLFFVADGPLLEQMYLHYDLQDTYVIPDCRSAGEYFAEMVALRPHERAEYGFLLFHQLLAHLSRIVHRRQQAMESPAEKLKKKLDESEMTPLLLKEYALLNELSEAHLIRLFRAEYQITPHRYLLNLRLDAARRMLLYSRLSIKEIAARFCFSNQYYFSAAFREKYGVPPRAYRDRYGS